MKIAVWHNLPSGGGKRALYTHVRGLAARGHAIEAWSPSSADSTYLPLGDLVVEHRVAFAPSARRRTRLGDLAAGTVDAVRRIEAWRDNWRRAGEEIALGRFDVLFANSCAAFGAAGVGRFLDGPRLLYLQEPRRRLHDALPEPPWVAPDLGRPWYRPRHLKAWVRDIVRVHGLRLELREELANARAFDRILVSSRFNRESVLRAYGLDAVVCPLGVDADLFRPGAGSRADFVIGVGAFHPHKNIRFVIDALATIGGRRPRLVWVGNARSAYLDEMRALAERRGVEFVPKLMIPDAELVRLLGRARALVYAPRLEPFGFAPLEANACGTPVVAVAEGGVRETVIDGVNGFLVDDDPLAFADAVVRLLEDPRLGDELGRRGRELVIERWSVEASIDRVEAQLGAVATGGTVRAPALPRSPAR